MDILKTVIDLMTKFGCDQKSFELLCIRSENELQRIVNAYKGEVMLLKSLKADTSTFRTKKVKGK